ncbi:hypothetical protein [Methylobacterium sp. Leaf86]|uniref:hypothetical protein n=1 Tax=Methylobacterium sp. Leaf86 TaxID=1736242 RepID=UPI000AAA61CC|nr:hypothetical protein [Methylobacterium sp. Leaf86]
MDNDNPTRDRKHTYENTRASIALGSLSYTHSPKNPIDWGKNGDCRPYTNLEWRNEHLSKLATIKIQGSDLAWEMAQDFDCFDTIFNQFVGARFWGETDKNPFYVYGRTKSFKIMTYEIGYFEVQQSAKHADDFDADFMEFARKISL